MDGLPALPADLPDYVRRYLDGESMQSIAQHYGVHRATLYRHMLRDLGSLHEDVISDMLITRVAQADDELASARDACDIARAREQARFARMDLERRRPALYGQRSQLTVDVGTDLGNLLRDARARVARQQQPVLEQRTIDADVVLDSGNITDSAT